MKYFLLFITSTLIILSCNIDGDTSLSSDTILNANQGKNQLKQIKKMGPGKYAAYHEHIRTKKGDKYPSYEVGHKRKELLKQKNKSKILKSKQLEWIERGPGNVAGRTRDIIYDKRDESFSTWTVGSAGGGVWRTTDAGKSWTHLTEDLPNLSTASIVRSDAAPDILYVGTGDIFRGINGDGIYKSIDNGESFQIISATSGDDRFGNVSRMVISPTDPDQLWVATVQASNARGTDGKSRVMKTGDGGDSWIELYSNDQEIQQIVMSPDDVNTLYISVNSDRIFRSDDAGSTWTTIYNASDHNIARMELAVSPTDTDVLYISGESNSSVLLKSENKGDSWVKVRAIEFGFGNWLGGQGWYDNTIAVHPYNRDIVFVGGAGSILEINTAFDSIQIANLELIDSTELLNPDTRIEAAFEIASTFQQSSSLGLDDLVDINITFSKGNSLAYRLSQSPFNGNLSSFERIRIPIKAIDNDGIQYGIGWIDEDRDQQWDFKENDDEEEEAYGIMEGFFIFNITESEIDNIDILSGDILDQSLYYIEVQFPEGKNLNSTLRGSVSIENGTEIFGQGADYIPVADGYFEYFDNFPEIGSKGVHVDHHNIVLIPTDEDTQNFYMLNANDGGVALSKDSGQNFIQTGDTFKEEGGVTNKGFNTSQFYGLDKMNGADRYVGGTQDNGSWVSAVDPNKSSEWVSAPSGDGFEAAWHYEDANLIIETSQFNSLFKSIDGGISWQNLVLPPSEGPFVTRVANSKTEPDMVLLISDQGVLKSLDFGDSWEVISMPDNWFFGGFGAPIKISLASPLIVWTGEDNESLTVSQDAASSFKATKSYNGSDLGALTGLTTHPINPNKAYALYSIQGEPKILMTEDLGQSWTDLTQFSRATSRSENGFPDVATTSLLVMPYDTTIIWAGTEIGLFESIDNGQSWHYADSGLPPVSIWEMKIVNDEVILATHGRGIWSVSIPELENYEPVAAVSFPDLNINSSFASEVSGNYNLTSTYDSSQLILKLGSLTETIKTESKNPAGFVNTFDLDLDEFIPAHEVVTAKLIIESYLNGQVIKKSRSIQLFKVNDEAKSFYVNDFESDEKGFATKGLTKKFVPDILKNGLASTNPYSANENSIAILQTPIIVKNGQADFSYDEIVQVEPGFSDDPDSDFFYDYVSVEATSDQGENWIRLAKYDSQSNSAWLANYNANSFVNDSLVRNRVLDLSEFFDSGDTVIVRFQLVSDGFVEGWGWYVDNINYGEVNTAVSNIDLSENKITISPNPVKDEAQVNLELSESGLVNLSVYNIQGQKVKQVHHGQLSKGSHRLKADLQSLKAGTYILLTDSASSYRQVTQLIKM